MAPGALKTLCIAVKSKPALRSNSPVKTAPSSAPSSPAKAAPTSQQATPPPPRQYTHDEIAGRARTLWEKRGRPEGQDAEIWYAAEAELRESEAQRADDDRFANKDALLDKDGDPNDQVDQRLDDLAKPRTDRSATSL